MAGQGEISLEPLLTVGQVAQVLGKKPSFVYEQRVALSLPFIRVGREYRMTKEDFATWISQQSKN
jgi:excisionase family DNA binding protein